MTSGADDALAAHELDLVTSAARGDEAAFDRFYDKHGPAVQLLVERLLGPGAAADGVVAEAFEKTVRRLPLLGARNSSPALYVLATARNGAYASLGRERPSGGDGPLGALLKLPSRQRELLALRELGLSADECAEVAGVEPGEVGVQVARARLRLADELEGATLSSVFADDRAERLLAAEVVRQEGAPLPPALDEEIVRHADENARFAAALSAVRSPSRSVGQLPPATGSARLANDVRARAVGAGQPVAPRPATSVSAAAAAAGTAATGQAAASGAADAPSASPSDPFDVIGDEAAWGIVDDDDAPLAPAGPGAPRVDSPTDGQWEDGAGAVSHDAPTELSTTPAAPGAAAPGSAPGADPSLADPFAGWDDVDWHDEEDDREWTAGPTVAGAASAGAAGAAAASTGADEAGSAPADLPTELTKIVPVAPTAPEGVDLGETRPFDAVAAGLADPDPEDGSADAGDATAIYAAGPVAAVAGLPGNADGAGGDPGEPRKRSPWRWVLWFLALVALFVGAAFAAYVVVSATDDPELPPSSQVTQSSPREAAPAASTPTGTTSKNKSSSSSSSNDDDDDSTSSTPSGSSSSSSNSSGSSGSSSTGGGSTGSSTSGNNGGSGSTGSGNSGGGGSSGTATKPPSSGGTVTPDGDSTSGGSVRGDTGTTP